MMTKLECQLIGSGSGRLRKIDFSVLEMSTGLLDALTSAPQFSCPTVPRCEVVQPLKPQIRTRYNSPCQDGPILLADGENVLMDLY